MKKILLVAMSNSIHTARWIDLIPRDQFEVHLFPSIDVNEVHPDIHDVQIHGYKNPIMISALNPENIINKKLGKTKRIINHLTGKFSSTRDELLKKVITDLNPDIVHSLETQNAGYLVLRAKKRIKKNFPCWIHTLWGSDLFVFSKMKEHLPKIKSVLSCVDYLLYECNRDFVHSKKLGFSGKGAFQIYGAGGFDIEKYEKCRLLNTPSKRKLILLKGYQGWAGRSLVGLRALERASDILSNYSIRVYSANTEDIKIAIDVARHDYHLDIETIPLNTKHDEMLELFSKSRISIGISKSDGLPNSLLESMLMGAFPIQSCTSCADEWISDGFTGIIVPPDDPEIIENAIRLALSNDKLIDTAAEKNFSTVKAKLDKKKLLEYVRSIYTNA